MIIIKVKIINSELYISKNNRVISWPKNTCSALPSPG